MARPKKSKEEREQEILDELLKEEVDFIEEEEEEANPHGARRNRGLDIYDENGDLLEEAEPTYHDDEDFEE